MSTDPASRERIKEVFANALAVAPAARLAALDEACAGDAELRTTVEDLLNNYDSAQRFFAQFPPDFAREVLDLSNPPARMFSAGELVADRFLIVCFLGAGGMGEVYEAEDRLLDRQRIALKTLPAPIAADPLSIARLKREIALARRVTHPNVCRVFDVDEHVSSKTTIAFFTMELLEGETLSARLKRNGPLPIADARSLLGQMAAALGAAHAAGVIHGDFKPGNVVLVPSAGGEERLVVTDFGLARLAATDAASGSATNSLGPWGTPMYMAPEQFAGQRATRASDVYALAAVGFEMVTGSPVIDADWTTVHLDPAWHPAILRCLDHNPEARFQTVDELLRALSPRATRPRVGWRRAVASAGLGAGLLLLVPSVRTTLGTAIQGTEAALFAKQQSIAVLASTAEDRTSDGAAFSRGVASAITEQLGSLSQFKPHLLFVSGAPAIDRGANSLDRVPRTLGVDVMVTVGVQRLAAQTQVTIEMHHASAQQPTLMQSRRFSIDGGDRLLPVARTEVARMLEMRLTTTALPAMDAGGAMPAATEQSYIRGRGYLEQGRTPQPEVALLDLAIAEFQQAIALDGTYAPAHAALSETLVLKYQATKETGKDTRLLDSAERSAAEACRLQPTTARYYVVRALTYLATGRHGLTIPLLEEALRIDPDAAGARESLANSYLATNQLSRAEQTLEQAIARHPRSWSAHEDLGVFEVNQGQYKKAETHFMAGRQFAPDNPRVIYNLAGLYTMTELSDAAEQELIRGVDLAPDPILYNNLGWAYFYQGEFAKGVDSLKKAVGLTNDSVVVAGLARGYRWMGRENDARLARDTAITASLQQIHANPKNAVIGANLAYLYAETLNHAEAGRQIGRALEDAPANVRVRFTAALVFELIGQRHSALQALESAIDGGHPKYQIAHHPDLQKLRTDSRYVQLIAPRQVWKR